MKTFYELLFSFLIVRDIVDIKQHMISPKKQNDDIERVANSTRSRVNNMIYRRINKKVA